MNAFKSQMARVEHLYADGQTEKAFQLFKSVAGPVYREFKHDSFCDWMNWQHRPRWRKCIHVCLKFVIITLIGGTMFGPMLFVEPETFNAPQHMLMLLSMCTLSLGLAFLARRI